jgi:hypothetical protein
MTSYAVVIFFIEAKAEQKIHKNIFYARNI